MKKDKEKKLIQNWRSISLLNFDLKILFKALGDFLKYLHSLILSNQTAYAQERFTSEGGRLFTNNKFLEVKRVTSNG